MLRPGSHCPKVAAKRGDAPSKIGFKEDVLLGEGGRKPEVSKVSGQVDLKEKQHTSFVDQVAFKVNDKDHNSPSVEKPAWR